MPGRGDELLNGGAFHDPARVHHRHVVRQLGHHAEVVGDEDHRRSLTAAQIGQKFDDLGLNGHVESGGGFIGDEQFRIPGQSHGDHHPLLHAPRKLVGEIHHPRRGVGDPHRREEPQGFRLAVGDFAPVEREHLGDLVPDPEDRVQGGQGLLKDVGDAAPADFSQFPGRKLQQFHRPFSPLETGGIRSYDGGLRIEPGQRQARGALAAARLPHQGQNAAPVDRKGNAVDHGKDLFALPEPDGKIFDFKQTHSSSPRKNTPFRRFSAFNV